MQNMSGEGRSRLRQPRRRRNSDIEEGKGKTNNAISILQWNADGLNTKVNELRNRLQNENIDICNIQESKLQPHMPTPNISGYKATKRIDRKGGIQGGGLITYAKESVVFKGGGDSSKKATDVATTNVQLTQKN